MNLSAQSWPRSTYQVVTYFIFRLIICYFSLLIRQLTELNRYELVLTFEPKIHLNGLLSPKLSFC